MLEQTRPKRGEKKERPPVYAFVSALEQRNGEAAGGALRGLTRHRSGGEGRVQM